MKRTTINYWIDFGLLISFLIVFITGVLKLPELNLRFMYTFIPGRTFAMIHDWSGLIMGALVVAHLILHWRWFVAMTKRHFKI